ncbi:tetrathionate reductase regulon response regulator [Pasteurella multocida]|nr:tetrathionate reductase regulon response regulator [Pasteurella multocida]
MLIQGCINRQIAEALNISVRTVEVHRSHIMEKMQAQTIAELIYKTAQL